MAFAEKKFRALQAASQAKKIADLLADCARESDANRSAQHLNEARRLRDFACETKDTDAQNPDGSASPFDSAPVLDAASTAREIYAAYLFWRRAAGLGPEAAVLQCFDRRSQEVSGEAAADNPNAPRSTIDYSVWLHDIRSGFNAGAVIRTAECLGFRRVYLSGFTPGPDHRSVRSAAMGCEEWIECVRHTATPDFARPESEPAALIVLESPEVPLPPQARRKQTISYSEYQWPGSGIIVVGNEELGVPAAILADADAIVTIPMYGRKASLNLASSFAIAAARARETSAASGPRT
ncbi:MAG: hypothetical protein NXI24_03330 [bacterium]|nr:hypothetical protein [bacterium]